ncbi:TetR family transcriptional regulator [Aestuariivirga sp.]|uniref:TetR family transcriptional regulator n=1 Tax=Aestuariivirga sp. TaxID=2650926 RepID=UPI003BA8FC23
MDRPHSSSSIRPPRTLDRDVRKAQLIEATIGSLAERGFSRTTLTEVARRAGLSHGLVLFHFRSKEGLLTETLDYLSEEYRQHWTSALEAAGGKPQQQLAALVTMDFTPEVCRPDRLAAWCAFWGESQSRPLYHARCSSIDAHYIRSLENICQRMNAECGYRHDAGRVARLIRVTIEGTWLDLVTLANPYDRAEALKTVWVCIAALYPRHFGPDGLTADAPLP